MVERFRREAISAAGLNHPYIVSIYDTIEADGRAAVVMELVPGRSLRNLLDESGRLGIDETLVIGRAVAAALDHAHQAGLVHRDVKPGNVLVTPEGRVKLTDFGIAKAVERSHEDLTAENVMMGTAKYLSPEQVLGFPLDGRADLYSLGLVLYECLTGEAPVHRHHGRRHRHRPAAARPDPHPPAPGPRSPARSPMPCPASWPAGPRTARRPQRPPGRCWCKRPTVATTPPFLPSPCPPPSRGGAARVARPADDDTGPGVPVRGRARAAIIGLAAAAAVGVGAVAWASRDDGGTSAAPSRRDPTSSPNPAGPSAPCRPHSGALGSAQPGPVTIQAVQELDPPPGDGVENPAALAALTDGDPDHGLDHGLLRVPLPLSEERHRPRSRPVRSGRRAAAGASQWPRGPWRVSIYTADLAGQRARRTGATRSLSGAATTRVQATFSLGDSDGRYVLVWLTQLAPADACSTNPYQGAVGELAIEPDG